MVFDIFTNWFSDVIFRDTNVLPVYFVGLVGQRSAQFAGEVGRNACFWFGVEFSSVPVAAGQNPAAST